nr:glyoxylate/hydroxypyruvate reductase A [Lautropia sp.]
MPTGPARPPIAFIGSLSADEEQAWLDALRRAMPQERLLPAAAIADNHEVELAIVANPDPAVVRRFDRLKWMQSLWAGVERLVAEPAFDGLPLVRMVDPELARTMAEAVLAWTLYLHRDMPAYLAQQRATQWLQLPYVPPSRRRVGLLGLGVLGVAAARRLGDAGFPVLGWSRTPKRLGDLGSVTTFSGSEGLMAMVSRTDILVCLLPLTDQTRHLVDEALLQAMPAHACLINFGRGPVVNLPDLVAALSARGLKHAVLD